VTPAAAVSLAHADLTAIGVAVRVVVTDPAVVDDAAELVAAEVDALDRACSRFRDDSELALVNSSGGRPVDVGPVLAGALQVALQAARSSGGDVDPTLGATLVELGYDRDLAQLPADGPPVLAPVYRTAHWSQVQLDRRPDGATVRLPAGAQLDLGATAKAWCADRAAARVHRLLRTGVLVSLGGDIAVAGSPPEDGWPIRVQDRPEQDDGPACTVAIRAGGLATSSVTARRWRRGGQRFHHLLDPSSGLPAAAPWRTVSVAAPTCLDANIATTAAVVRGERAVQGLLATGLPARLVDRSGAVRLLNGWPA
jgi:FAD:protein FMN transferase